MYFIYTTTYFDHKKIQIKCAYTMNYQYESLSSSYLILLTKYLFLYKNFGHNLFLKLLSIKVTQ